MIHVSVPSLWELATISLWTSLFVTHIPYFSDNSEHEPDHAVLIKNVDLSQVFYHEVTDQFPSLWMAFEGREGQQVSFRIGIPKIENFKFFRPTIALVGPGFPPVVLPFDIPTGLGGRVFPTDKDEPEEFHEPFSSTDSWMFRKIRVALPQSGRYYLIAYSPLHENGKLWVAVGEKERFSPLQIARLPFWIRQIREFHEAKRV
jgi:hypothetical protein